MGLFNLLNYEDYILRTVVTSSYARNVLIVVLIYLLTAIVRFHISVVICWLVSGTFFGDMILPIIINVLLALWSDTLYQYIGTHRPHCERLVDYLMTNYSSNNVIKWKRYILAGLCCYIFLVVAVVTLDNYFIFLSTVQTALSFIVCDMLEHRHEIWDKCISTYKKWWYKPRVNVLLKYVPLINSYMGFPPEISPRNNSFYDLISDHDNLLAVSPASSIEVPTINSPVQEVLWNKESVGITGINNDIAPVMYISNEGRISPPILPKPVTPPAIRYRTNIPPKMH